MKIMRKIWRCLFLPRCSQSKSSERPETELPSIHLWKHASMPNNSAKQKLISFDEQSTNVCKFCQNQEPAKASLQIYLILNAKRAQGLPGLFSVSPSAKHQNHQRKPKCKQHHRTGYP